MQESWEEAYGMYLQAQEEAEDLSSEVADLEWQVDDLEQQISDLEDEKEELLKCLSEINKIWEKYKKDI